MKLKNGTAFNITPTKTWRKEHSSRPCDNKDCYCVLDAFDDYNAGCCGGLMIDNDNMDIIRLCHSLLDITTNKLRTQSMLIHPNEALLLSVQLSMAVMDVLKCNPEYRKVLGVMGRRRHKIFRDNRCGGTK